MASGFYSVDANAMLLGLARMWVLQATTLLRMLFYSAVLNAALAPQLVALVVLLTRDPKIMCDCVSSGQPL